MFSKGLLSRHVKTRACLGKVKGCYKSGLCGKELKLKCTKLITAKQFAYSHLSWTLPERFCTNLFKVTPK